MRYLEIAPNQNRGINWDGVRDVPAPGCMVYDMRKLPMRGVMDNEYNAVYSEHFIEHLTKDPLDLIGFVQIDQVRFAIVLWNVIPKYDTECQRE